MLSLVTFDAVSVSKSRFQPFLHFCVYYPLIQERRVYIDTKIHFNGVLTPGRVLTMLLGKK